MTDISEIIYEVECTLACQLKSYIDNGIGNADICQVKETADAIKDLAEAKYYCIVTKAMEEKEEYPYDKMGYAQPHYPGGTSGRMTSGNRMGYDNGRSGDYNGGNSNYGYHDDMTYRPMVDQEPYISGYLDYKDAKRHYTETHSMSDKNKMDTEMERHFNDLIKHAKEMYKDADISHKQEMKQDIIALGNEM